MAEKPTWLMEAIWQGLAEIPTDDLLAQAALHVSLKGNWESQVISPSLCSVECRLQRLKRFLGHEPVPGKDLTGIAIRQGKPDGQTNLNFLRGFLMEGIIVTCLKHALGDRVLEHAPLYNPIIEQDGIRYSAHPDVLVEGPKGELELVQVKSNGVFAQDRLRKLGRDEVWKKYGPQMGCEMFVVRRSGLAVVCNHLVAASFETLPSWHERARVLSWDFAWSVATDQATVAIAEDVMQDVVHSKMGRWPEALPESIAANGSWPCAYCSWSRTTVQDLGSGQITPGCDDHMRWELKVLPAVEAAS